MDIIISIASEVVGCLVAPIKRKLGYLFDYNSNVENLKTQLKKLEDVKTDVKEDVDNATRNGEEIKQGVKTWQRSADGITEKAGKILLENEDKAKKRCLVGLCPNLKSCYQLSKKAKKAAEEVVKIQDGGKFNKVSRHPPRQGMGSTSIKGYETFESRVSTLKEIMEALRDPNIDMIGVYGMGGVGKTMLVKEVARKAKEDKLFNEVVMAVVSQPPNIRKIQEEIAYPLGLEFDAHEMDSKRVDRLCGRLKQEKSILIILDDVWAQLDLEALGIPLGASHEGCKIMVTSRRLDVLSNQMNIQRNFRIVQLLEEEAWNLFKKMADVSVEDPNLKPTALEVAKECAGLPIALVVVVTALKNKSLFVWKDALYQLRLSAPTTIEGMDAKVYSSLKLSYNFLENDAQSLFLLCSLLPEDYQFSIRDLLNYGKGLGLFKGINTLEIARNRVHALVDHLKASCLLLDGNTSGSFRMHDVVRDVGIFVASKEKHMLIGRNSVELEEWIAEEKLKFCSALSLPYTDIHELLTGLESPELKFFLFFSKESYSKIPNTFFEGMKQLKVLTLSGISFSTLPSSLHFLSSLQTLCMHECKLLDISIIGELKKLEILSFRDSDIRELPREIGKLSRLKLLDLTGCYSLQVIPSNVIASLSQLEELYMERSFNEWEVDGNARLAELKDLSRLVTLETRIRDANILPSNLVFEKLMRYNILIGDVRSWSRKYEFSRTLKLGNTSILSLSGKNMLWKRTEDLYLERLNGCQSIINDLNGEGFLDLKHLSVKHSSEIEYVINTMTWVPPRAFPNLEDLVLGDLINLKEICHGQLPVESFCNLKRVKMEGCGRLQNLFSLSMVTRLSKLQEIEIISCTNMDGIVTEGREVAEDNNEAMNRITLPQLRSLELVGLPNLKCFSSKVKAVSFLNDASTSEVGPREIISEGEHDSSIPFFNEKVAFPNLEKLVFRYIAMKEIWHSQLPLPDGSFCKLKHLEVNECLDLSEIVPSNMLMRLLIMESMTVRNCGDYLQYIFDLGGINHIERNVVRTCSELRHLDLYGLPSLINIWKNDSPGTFTLQKLSSLMVYRCPSLQNIFTTSRAKSLVQLQELFVKDCDEMEEIVKKEGADEEEATDKIVFPQVNDLTLDGLPKLKSFCQGIRMSEWPSLKTLKVSSCDNVEIFASELRSFEETRGNVRFAAPTKQPLFFVNKVAFPSLEELELKHLPMLTDVIVGKEGAEEEAMDKILFSHLTSLTFFNLPLLKNGIRILEWSSLKKLDVSFCDNVEILGWELSSFEKTRAKCQFGAPPTEPPLFLLDKVAFPNLERLYLFSLPRLMAVWMNNSQGSLYFQKLGSLDIHYCENLINIFATSEAKNFEQLPDMVEEINEKEEEAASAMDKIMFPQVKSLTLECLTQLRSFCQWIHISEWPSLKDLNISECHNMEIFASELNTFRETRAKANHGTPTKQPFFLVDKVAFPKLEEMKLKRMSSMVEIWQGQFHAPSFCKLRVLEVKECNKILKVFPISLLQNFQNLEEVYVESCSSLEEVFEIEGLVGEIGHASTFPPLRILSLIQLPKLMHLWKEDSQLSAVFQNLKTLHVRSCESLTHLFSSSIAEGLVQIESITVADEKREATYGTIFSQLYSLELKDLPNLTSFCPGSNNFSFPSLEEVLVEECSELKTFSNNILYTPKLEEVHVNWIESIWYGDLNTTIQQLFKQKNAQVSEED